MNIRTKVIVLLSAIIILFMASLAASIAVDMSRAVALYDIEKTESGKVFDEIVRLEGHSLEIFVYDYTYWDELVEFVATADETWALENLKESMGTYNADVVWVYNPKLEPVYTINSREDAVLWKDVPVGAKKVGEIFKKDNRFCHFFVNTPEGVMEIRGATIHPTWDEKRKTDPKGYFMVGRLLDGGYLSRLSEYLSGIDVKISSAPGSAANMSEDIKTGYINFSRALKNWDGEITAYFEAAKISLVVLNFSRTSRHSIILVALFAAVVLAALFVFFTMWINAPLRKISRALEHDDAEAITPLLSKWDEFGRIAQLIDNFFRQRRSLVAEIERRKKLEDELSAKLAQLRQFKDIAVGREIKMIELKKEVNRLSKELGRPEPYESAF